MLFNININENLLSIRNFLFKIKARAIHFFLQLNNSHYNIIFHRY